MGFDLLKLNIWKIGALKQAKYLVSAERGTQEIVYVNDEEGTISIEPLKANTGFLNSTPEIKKTWMMIPALKFRLAKDDEVMEDRQLLIVCNRDYLPLDPNKTLTVAQREKLASLKTIAKERHAIRRMDAGKYSPLHNVNEVVINGCFVILGIAIPVWFLWQWLVVK